MAEHAKKKSDKRSLGCAGDEKMRDILDTATGIAVSTNKAKGQRRHGTTCLFKIISVLSIMTFLHLNIYITVFLMPPIMFLLPSCPPLFVDT